MGAIRDKRIWLWSFAIWTAVAIVFWVTWEFAGSRREPGSHRIPVFALSLLIWEPFALFTPFIVALTDRLPFTRGRIGSVVAGHVAGAAMLTLTHNLLTTAVLYLWDWMPADMSFGALFLRDVANVWPVEFILYTTIAGTSYALAFSKRLAEQRIEAQRLRTELVQARLSALKMQLEPHFLFNTLHAIGVMMRRDVEAAERMIARLADLLRMSLESGEQQEVRLSEELQFLEPYLEIQRMRFGDRLDVRVDVDSETERALVPALLVQPLVENAVRHGIETRAGAGKIRVAARREGDMLRLTVEDDGAGLSPEGGSSTREGVGLGNTRERLRRLYGDRQRLDLIPSATGGVRAVVEVPYRAEAVS